MKYIHMVILFPIWATDGLILGCGSGTICKTVLFPEAESKQKPGAKARTSSSGLILHSEIPIVNFSLPFTYILAFHLYNEVTRKSHNHRFEWLLQVRLFLHHFSCHHPIYRQHHLKLGSKLSPRTILQSRGDVSTPIPVDLRRFQWVGDIWGWLHPNRREHVNTFSVLGCPARKHGWWCVVRSVHLTQN